VLLYLAVPVIAGFLYLFGTRQLLAEHCQVEDLPSRREILRHGDVLPGFERLIVDHRDAHLLRVIEETCEKAGSENMRVAIVYGARHMRAVTRLLMGKLGYRVLDAEWIIVFDV
jgi:hypothetical protein